MNSCILWAWHLDTYHVSSPLSSATYDIVANAERGASTDEMRLMLRALLAERFGLRVHTEKRDRQVVELSIAKGGLKSQRSAGHSAELDHQNVAVRNGVRTETWKNAPMEALTAALAFHMFAPVVDRTGLTGTYDFSLIWPPMTHGPPGEFYLAWKDAIEHQLGLTTRLVHATVDTLVVDHVNEVPAAN